MSSKRRLLYLKNRKIIPSVIIIVWFVVVIIYSFCVRDAYLAWDQSNRIDPPVLPCFPYLTIIIFLQIGITLSLFLTRMHGVSGRSDILYLLPASFFVLLNSIIYLDIISLNAIFIWHIPYLVNIGIIVLGWLNYKKSLVDN